MILSAALRLSDAAGQEALSRPAVGDRDGAETLLNVVYLVEHSSYTAQSASQLQKTRRIIKK